MMRVHCWSRYVNLIFLGLGVKFLKKYIQKKGAGLLKIFSGFLMQTDEQNTWEGPSGKALFIYPIFKMAY